MSEKAEAKRIGAKLVKNSGRGMNKADMTIGKFIIDLKEVGKEFVVNKQVWRKICSDAATYGYESVPVLMIKFEAGQRLAVLDFDDLESLINESEDR